MMIEALKNVRFCQWCLLTPIIFCLVVTGYAQNIPVEKHRVQKGETLYSISKKYNISQEELIQLNPGLEQGLREGAELSLRKAVAPPVTKQEQSTEISGNTHVVSAGDTWYSLAKKYGVTIEQLQEANKSSGTELRLEQRIQIPMAIREIEQWKPSDSSTFSVAIMLPFYIQAPDSIKNKNRKFQKVSIQFYRGAMMAIDKVERFGLQANVEFYDVYQDTNTVTQAIKKMKKTNPDICIGPLFKESIAHTINLLGPSSTHFVMPVQLSPKILLLDKDISKVVPGSATEWGYLASHLLQQEKLSECILVQSGNQEDTKLINAFKDEWIRLEGGLLTELSLKEIADVEQLKTILVDRKRPVVIFPSSDESAIRKMISTFDGYSMHLFGDEKWLPISDLSPELPSSFSVSAIKSNFLDYSDTDFTSWIEKYRIAYKSEPDEFALLGYDVTMYYLCGLLQFGKEFNTHLNLIRAPMISHVFDFVSTGAESGFENRHTRIISVGENGALKIANK